MTQTIGNPLSYAAQRLAHAGHHAAETADALTAHEDAAGLTIHPLTSDDLRAALRLGWKDFKAARSDVILLCVLYPVMGLILAGIAFQQALIPLLFPLASGFALLGPAAAVGLYEISRRRESGEAVNWASAFGVIGAPSFGAIIALGLYLMVLFAIWIGVAHGIYMISLGPDLPASVGSFVTAATTTPEGWAMIVLGSLTGFIFALVVLAVSLVSFPLLLDRPVGLVGAVTTSLRVFAASPRTVCTWGLLVAACLFVGAVPLLLGLVIVIPVLGHATWHLYRRAVS